MPTQIIATYVTNKVSDKIAEIMTVCDNPDDDFDDSLSFVGKCNMLLFGNNNKTNQENNQNNNVPEPSSVPAQKK